MPSSTSTKYSSLSQSFRVSVPDGVPGVFVSKLGLYFRAKSDSLGVQVYIVRQKNGVPDLEKVVTGSLVTLESEDVQVSEDGVTETVFTFPQLVYLNASESYSFVVKPVGNSPDYQVWVGELGKRDIFSDKPIGSNPLVETAYYSGNQDRFADLINQDIKFKLYRARFTSTNGSASLRNKSSEILKLYSFSPITGIVDVKAGDQVFGWSNGYVNTSISGTVTRLDLVNKLLYVKNSSANFQANSNIAVIRTAEEGNTSLQDSGLLALARIETAANDGLYKLPIHAVAPKLNIKQLPFTGINLELKGAVYNGTKYIQDTAKQIQNNTEIEFKDQARYLLGETDESSAANDFRTGTPSTNTSVSIKATLETDSNFISPTINLNRNSVVLLRNLINANTQNEHTEDGAAEAKYISKTVTLEDGMEADDLKIYVTANKPANTDVIVYTKIWDAADPQDFDLKVWSKMALENIEKVRNTNSPDEYLEYVYSFATTSALAGNALAAFQTSSSVPVSYSSANSTGGVTGGPSYGGSGRDGAIKKFAVKVVLTADSGNEYLYPKVNDLRVIALKV